MTLETTVPDVAGGASSPPGRLAVRWVFPDPEDGGGRLTELETGETQFGRDGSCAGHLPSASVSRSHAAVRWSPGSVPMLRDLDSTNGVFVNGARVRQAPLKLRDVLRMGDFVGVLVALPAGPDTAWTFEEVTAGYWAGPALLAALEPARRVAATDLPIIIQGETGSGKEGAAHAIAAWSARGGPFVAVNCAALPETLAESELFGYRRGAFSGADRAHAGFLRAANGGTLLLDEIADLALPVQAKLLRAIEQREVVPLGESAPSPIDVRFLTAAQGPLRQAVEEGRFRADLLARLEGLTVKLPPLRERVEEIPSLFSRLVERYGGARSTSAPRLDPLLVERLCTHDWPFNVRELTLLARRLLALYPSAAVLELDMLSAQLPPQDGSKDRSTLPAPPAADARTVARGDGPPAPLATARGEDPDPDRDALLSALRAARGNVKRTAAALGISRGRLYRLMERVGSLEELATLRQPAPPRQT